MIKKKTSTKAKKGKDKMPESHMHHLHAGLFAIAVITVLAVGVPVMLWAQAGDAPRRVNVDGGALMELQMKLGELQKALDVLMESKQDLGEAGMAYVSRPDDARADCLNDCRMQQVRCMDGFQGVAAPGVLHPCLSGASECITACNDAPRAPVSCQDRCAVALGGCIERIVAPTSVVVDDEEASLDECRLQNVECLTSACSLSDQVDMPDSYCADQCRRMHIICSTGSSQYDVNEMELCTRLQQTCEKRLCARVGLLPNIKTMEDVEYGTYLADGNGMALYTFSDDVTGGSKCTGSCLENWPVFFEEDLWVGEGLDSEAFGTIDREDGGMQVTFRGWPLYYYAGDKVMGEVNGHTKMDSKWLLASPYRNALTREQCEYACDDLYEECKRSDEMPYACQQKLESCKGGCLNLESSEML